MVAQSRSLYRSVYPFVLIIARGVALLLVVLLSLRYLAVPLLVLLAPGLDIRFYDLATYGAYPEQSYVTINQTSPRTTVVQWDSSCDDGLVLLAMDGPSIDSPGPMILDKRGDLVWTSDHFGHAANLKVQRYRGQDYLTFWAGEKLQESGQGMYYMVSRIRLWCLIYARD